ncbi:MAG: methyltransferase domain-containing protein [Burkholderiales bacterium]|nr:methyltransferase domain-containing protein [Burkholderiales bacterium]
MGTAEGVMTDLLVASGRYRLTVVEGSKRFCDDLWRRHSGISVVHSPFETIEPERGFDNIVLGDVLEHVEQPVDLLRKCKA